MKLRQFFILAIFLFLGACSGSGSNGGETSAAPSAPTAPSNPVIVSPTAMQPGDYNKTITIGSDLRSYILHVPTGYDGSQALPLVFVLHGGGGTSEAMVHSTQMNEKANQENFIVVYLQALGDIHTWNTEFFPFPGIAPDDDAYVIDLLHQLEADLNVDSKRVYASGFSNGAMMTYRLAAEFPEIFAGVAVTAGTIGMRQSDGVTWVTIPDPQGPVPLLILHGTLDHTIPYDGGQGALRYVKSVGDAVDLWTSENGCTGQPQETTSIDGNVITEDYTSCDAASEVELITIQSGVHEWPSLNNHAHFAGTDAVWDFFSRH